MPSKFKKGIDLQGQRAINAGDASASSDLATLGQVQAFVRGLDNKAAVRVATTGNISLTSPGASIDGVTMVANDRVLVRAQTTATENGIYVWNGAAVAMTRAADADVSAEVTQGLAVAVIEGTTKGTGASQTAPIQYVLNTPDPITLGTTNLTFAVVGGAGAAYTADGNGIELSGTTFSLELDGTSLSKSASGLRIADAAAGAGLTSASGILAVGAGTGVSVGADTVGVDTAVVVRKYAADCAATTNPQTFTHGLGTGDLTIAVWEGSEQVYADVTKTGTTTFTVDFGSAPTAGQYRVVAHG